MALQKRKVGILIFDGVELLDFAGPYEVFSRTRLTPGVDSRRTDESAPFHVFTVAKSADPVSSTGGLKIIPQYSFAAAPSIDLLLIPGGIGTRALLNEDETLGWIRDTAAKAGRVTSVCTGSLLLAQAGLLRGRRATTHWGAFDLLQQISNSLGADISIMRGARFVDDGVVTSAGVSAGIDMALYLVEQMFGASIANDTAEYLEYIRSSHTETTETSGSRAARTP
jgi:transcriptional regulator GlxA family with amidase domain